MRVCHQLINLTENVIGVRQQSVNKRKLNVRRMLGTFGMVQIILHERVTKSYWSNEAMSEKAIQTEWAWLSGIDINHDANILYLDGVMYQPLLVNVHGIQLIGNAAQVAGGLDVSYMAEKHCLSASSFCAY